jgi:tetratricopeptide (TPR) repeat protein
VVAIALSNAPAASETNVIAVAADNGAKPAVSDGQKTPAASQPAGSKRDPSKPFLFLGLFVASLAGLGALAAWDVSHYFGSRTERELTAEEFELPSDPAYEAAEEEWAKGNHLDAINLMREYLKRNPVEQHVAIRIAEIYEKDLNNYLAAVLELEEVLKQKLPREKWGWTAIHLANLYSGKLNQTAKALGVLNRIVQHYPDTAAARKARQRLGIPEPEEIAAGADANEAEPPSSPESTPPAEPPAPSNLPKGFRTKK